MSIALLHLNRMKIRNLYKDFFNSEKAGGLILVFVTAISMIITNSAAGGDYASFWNTEFAGHNLIHWVNDGLMAIFFLLIGLELEREIYIGELSGFRKASLPIFAAVGGMIIPACIYLFLNNGRPTHSGFGIPMATDIAFAIGILSLLGNRVPLSLKIFLTALAVIDDLGAIIIIAVFYSSDLNLTNLFIALSIWAVLFALGRFKVYILLPYLIGGVAMWYFMLHSGVHATITGVMLAFAIPFGKGGDNSISYKLQHFLHKPVAFFILPVFAAANTIIEIGADVVKDITHPEVLGIFFGLVIGKPLGISLFAFLSVYAGVSALPEKIKWKHIISVGFLGGIGFTMSIFITMLAFNDIHLVNNSKIAIIAASVMSALIGFLLLKKSFSFTKK